MRNALINACLAIASSIFCIAILEIGLRVTGAVSVGPHPPLIYQTDENPAISYRLIPNIDRRAYRSRVVTNAKGFRSAPLDPSRPLVAVIGDSITFGYGVENDEALSSRLEALLPQFQFLNAGVPGYHLGQETALYRDSVAPLSPTGIILVFYPNDMASSTAWLDQDGVLRSAGDDPSDRPALRCNPITTGILGKIPGRCWLDTHSAIYTAVKKFISMKSANNNLQAQQERSASHPEDDSITDTQIAAYDEQLRAFVKMLPHGIPKIFVLWPDKELHVVSRPKIIARAKAHGFTVIDLYDTFGNTAKTLSWDTVHPHPETIARAAEVIAKQWMK